MPDIHEGPMGKAERVTIPDGDRWAVMVDGWLMTLPNQAPGNAWDQFLLQTITLSDVPGFPPATKRSPEVTHEMLVVSLEPKQRYTIDSPLPFTYMGKPNVVVQFHVNDDDQAREVTDMAAEACANGTLIAETTVVIFPFTADGKLDTSPGKGQEKVIKQVIDLWQQIITNTAEHVRTGGHHGGH